MREVEDDLAADPLAGIVGEVEVGVEDLPDDPAAGDQFGDPLL
jgi:hypothetical protein